MTIYFPWQLDRIFDPQTPDISWMRVIKDNYGDFGAVFKLHESVAQTYDDKFPYAYHLSMVINVAREFMPDDIPDTYKSMLLLAAAMHDTIEDARMTYNDVRKFIDKNYRDYFGLSDNYITLCVDIVYALTDEKGKNRKERHSNKYWCTLKKTPGACFIKMCDRMANIRYSELTGSRMLKVYRKEMGEFLQNIKGSVDIALYMKLYDTLQNLKEK